MFNKETKQTYWYKLLDQASNWLVFPLYIIPRLIFNEVNNEIRQNTSAVSQRNWNKIGLAFDQKPPQKNL